jgi:hypothetical protein
MISKSLHIADSQNILAVLTGKQRITEIELIVYMGEFSALFIFTIINYVIAKKKGGTTAQCELWPSYGGTALD